MIEERREKATTPRGQANTPTHKRETLLQKTGGEGEGPQPSTGEGKKGRPPPTVERASAHSNGSNVVPLFEKKACFI